MAKRWQILFVLFFARLTMAFQFQAVAALSPQLIDTLALQIADIGLLIGLYLGPGALVALPGGSIAQRFGDKRVVLAALVLMVLGGAMMMVESWGLMLTGRVVSGVGGVIINVVMTKMVVDWFAGREIGTAMSIFITSWSAGIALALLVLPPLAEGGLTLPWSVVIASILAALALVAAIYRPAPGSATVQTAAPQVKPTLPWRPLLMAGLLWALYNAAFAMVFGFGPLVLTEQGLPAAEASRIASLFILFLGLASPLGGILADRTGRGELIILTGFVAYLAVIPLLLVAPHAMLPFLLAAGGFLFGLSAGPIMTLPSLVLGPQVRAFGMGVFFTIYYVVMMLAPTVAGAWAERLGRADAAFFLGLAMIAACILALIDFRRTRA